MKAIAFTNQPPFPAIAVSLAALVKNAIVLVLAPRAEPVEFFTLFLIGRSWRTFFARFNYYNSRELCILKKWS